MRRWRRRKRQSKPAASNNYCQLLHKPIVGDCYFSHDNYHINYVPRHKKKAAAPEQQPKRTKKAAAPKQQPKRTKKAAAPKQQPKRTKLTTDKAVAKPAVAAGSDGPKTYTQFTASAIFTRIRSEVFQDPNAYYDHIVAQKYKTFMRDPSGILEFNLGDHQFYSSPRMTVLLQAFSIHPKVHTTQSSNMKSNLLTQQKRF
jgi:hypothetical protein